MKRLNIFLSLLFQLVVYVAYSQSFTINVEDQSLQTDYPEEVPVARYVGVTFLEMRNQFLEEWKKGDIILSNGNVITNQLIKYNNYSDELAWIRASDYQMGIIIKESIKGFVIYAKNNEPKKIFEKLYLNRIYTDEKEGTFLQILATGKDSVICLRKFNKAGPTDEYKLVNHYYLLSNGEFTRFYLQRSSIWNLFEKDEKLKMKSIIRSNHLWIRKESNMIRAFELYSEGK